MILGGTAEVFVGLLLPERQRMDGSPHQVSILARERSRARPKAFCLRWVPPARCPPIQGAVAQEPV